MDLGVIGALQVNNYIFGGPLRAIVAVGTVGRGLNKNGMVDGMAVEILAMATKTGAAGCGHGGHDTPWELYLAQGPHTHHIPDKDMAD